MGLLASAAARSRATAFGEDAYPSIHDKAAALLHSLARTQPLVDGNKRLALAATIAFHGINGFRLTLSNDEAYDLVMAVAVGNLDDVQPTACGRPRLPGGDVESTRSADHGRHLDEPTQRVDLAQLLRRPHRGVEQLLAHHDDSQRLRAGHSDVEPVQ